MNQAHPRSDSFFPSEARVDREFAGEFAMGNEDSAGPRKAVSSSPFPGEHIR